MDEQRLNQTSEVLAEESNAGTLALLSSARHFLTTRLLYQFIWKGGMTEAEFDQLAAEAWHVFIAPALYSFHTWLIEVADPETQEMMKESMVSQLIGHVRHDWDAWADETKQEWAGGFVS